VNSYKIDSFHWSHNSSLFQIELMSLWSADTNVSLPAWIISGRICSLPGVRPIQNVVRICKQITILILDQVISRLVAHSGLGTIPTGAVGTLLSGRRVLNAPEGGAFTHRVGRVWTQRGSGHGLTGGQDLDTPLGGAWAHRGAGLDPSGGWECTNPRGGFSTHRG
jgi:hypothetical protein